MIHALHIVQLYYPVASGAARYFAEIGERLVAEGHQVTVLATDAYDLEYFWVPDRRRVAEPEEWHRGVRIVRLPVRRLPGSPLAYPLLRRLMVELGRIPGTLALLRRMALLTPRLPDLAPFLARSGPFDLVHATNITLDFAVLPAFEYARRNSIPFVCTPFVHLGEPGDRTIARYYTMPHQIDLLRRSDRVITMTGIESAYLAERGVAREKLRRIGVGVNPVELAGGAAARFRSEQSLGDAPLVLFVGAMAYDKGAIHVVEAMRQLWNAGNPATLVMIGAPLAHFEAYYRQLPVDVQQQVRLLPYASDQIKHDALAAANLLVMPSRTDSFGIVYLEAWCYGLPVIGARAGGVPDVITDQHDGLLVRFGDVDELAGAIARVLSNPEEARRLGSAGQARVLRELTWEHIYAQARSVYAEVAEV